MASARVVARAGVAARVAARAGVAAKVEAVAAKVEAVTARVEAEREVVARARVEAARAKVGRVARNSSDRETRQRKRAYSRTRREKRPYPIRYMHSFGTCDSSWRRPCYIGTNRYYLVHRLSSYLSRRKNVSSIPRRMSFFFTQNPYVTQRFRAKPKPKPSNQTKTVQST